MKALKQKLSFGFTVIFFAASACSHPAARKPSSTGLGTEVGNSGVNGATDSGPQDFPRPCAIRKISPTQWKIAIYSMNGFDLIYSWERIEYASEFDAKEALSEFVAIGVCKPRVATR